AAAVMRRSARLADATLGGVAGQMVMGAFVSLKRRGRLRGCCGFFGQPTTLADALSQAATRTATEDVRLPPISPTELSYLDLEVWLLDGPKPVTAQGEQRLSEVVIGRHGLQVRRGKAGGLLLPGVAVDNHLDAEAFLEQVCLKANLPPTAWKEDDTHLLTFEGRCIAGPFDPHIADHATTTPSRLVTAADVAQLADHCRDNVVALVQGALASCFLPGGADGTVHGLSMTVRLPDGQPVPPFFGLSLRPGLPLQSTLYGLAEVAARTVASSGIDAQTLASLQVDLTVLWDPAMHGTIDDPHVDGIDPTRRAVLVMEGSKSAWAYNPEQSTGDLLELASREAQVRSPDTAAVFSLAAVSTQTAVLRAAIPQPQAGPKVRPPAVAGSFYPAGAAALSRLVNGLVTGTGSSRQSCPAVLVPHAGLQYSGNIAAAVFERVDIPEVVIVLGPRHRRQGVEWAVAPHHTWSLPGITVASDPEFAHQLAEAIPDLHLDALAHQQEHSIEVQLPLLAHFAPHTRVVGIALGAGDLERCRQFASGLAEVLRERDDNPMLIISSDLNHYASDAENRRLDEIALAALERLDPAEVYETVSQHKISMCGLLPAVVVLETLRQLGTLHGCQRVGYATSADAGGDTRRVVGYAGMLFG
ncbi:MAG: AmmeMemoRadiSam system protein B, partial [Candidatus Tectomicrobia bacterium]